MQATSTAVSTLQLILVAAFPTATALVGILIAYSQFGGLLRAHESLSKRMDDLNVNLIQLRNQNHSDIQMLTGKVIELMDRQR
jgi:hypothetical protein